MIESLPDLTLIILLIDFIGCALWMNARPGPWPVVTYLGTFVLGGLI